MANLKTDLPAIGLDRSKREIQTLSPSGEHEQVDGSSASATSTTTFYAGQIVRIFPITSVAYMKWGTGTATTSDIPFSADTPEYINIKVNTKLTFIGAVVDLTVML